MSRTPDEAVFIEVANAEAAKWLKAQGNVKNLVPLVDCYYTAEVAPGDLAALAAQEGIVEVEGVRYLRPQLITSLESINARASKLPAGLAGEGRGAVVAIVDYGLNVKLQDFQNPKDPEVRDAHNPDGRTRVAYLWDQELSARSGERVPQTYGYGVEYSAKDIDAALASNDFDLMRHKELIDENALRGHGTHVAGIAAGNGATGDDKFPAGNYVGVAPAASIVFVNLKRGAIIEHVATPAGTLGNSVHLAHAIAYCFEKADAMGMPCVVNLSLGFNGGGHDGNLAVEWITDALLQRSGRAVVCAAGNEENALRPLHACGTLRAGGTAELEWCVGDEKDEKRDPSPNEMEIWYSRGSALKVSLVDPSGRESDAVCPDDRPLHFVFGELGMTTIHSDSATPWKGDARIHISLAESAPQRGIRYGTWKVKLTAISVAPESVDGVMRFDAWIERTVPADVPAFERSRFAAKHYDPETTITLSTPSTGRRTIVVGSCLNTASGRLIFSDFSGRGPTRDRRRKPELTAPGEAVVASNARFGTQGAGARIKLRGTSMAAPHVTGVIARLLSRIADLTADEIRDVLVKTATRPPNGVEWDPKCGYGKVDAQRAVEFVDALLRVRPKNR